MLIVLGTQRLRAEEILAFYTPLPQEEENAERFDLHVHMKNHTLTLTYSTRDARDTSADILENLLSGFDVDSWVARILEYRALKEGSTP